jgi:pimeloyl-ACP methyl ester carboxylesterase
MHVYSRSLLHKSALTFTLFIHSALIGQTIGQSTEQSTAAINQQDTFVSMDVTRTFRTIPSQKASAPAQSSLNAKAISTETKLHMERGFDSTGNAVSRLTFPHATSSASKQRLGRFGKVEIVNDRLTIFDVAGKALPTPTLAAAPVSNLLPGVAALRNSSPLEGIVVSDVLAMAQKMKATVTSNDGSTAVVTITDSRKNRFRADMTFTKQGAEWVITKRTISSSTKFGDSQITTTYRNVTWHQSPAGDASRPHQHVPRLLRPSDPAPLTISRHDFRTTTTGVPSSGAASPQSNLAGATVQADSLSPPTDIFLQHGFLSNGGTWSRMVPLLNQDLALHSSPTPNAGNQGTSNLDSWLPDIVGQLQSGTSYIGIGHSAGGLVSRELAQQNSGLVRGVISVHSPHGGAPLVNNGTDQYIAGYIGDALNRLYVDLFDANDPNVSFAVGAANYILGDFIGSEALGLILPATQDFKVGSDYLNRLNGAGESFPRAGIIGESDYTGLVYRLVGDSIVGQSLGCNPEDCGGELFAATWGALEVAFESTGGIYEGYYFDCINNEDDSDGHCEEEWLYPASDYFDSAAALDSVDAFWQNLVANGASSDGFVPTTSQFYPNAPANVVIPSADSHLGAPRSLRVRDQLENLLRSQMFATTTACSFSVTGQGGTAIDGTGSVQEQFQGGTMSFYVSTDSSCSWSVGLSNGVEAPGATSFTGPGTVTLWADPNLTAAPVSASITIAGQAVQIVSAGLPFNSGVGTITINNKPNVHPETTGPPCQNPPGPQTIQVTVNDSGDSRYVAGAPTYVSPSFPISGVYPTDVMNVAVGINNDPSSTVWAGAVLNPSITQVVLISKSTSAADYPVWTDIEPFASCGGAVALVSFPGALQGSN